MGLILTSIICLLPQKGGTSIAVYYIASVTHGLCGGVYLAMVAALSYTAVHAGNPWLNQFLHAIGTV